MGIKAFNTICIWFIHFIFNNRSFHFSSCLYYIWTNSYQIHSVLPDNFILRDPGFTAALSPLSLRWCSCLVSLTTKLSLSTSESCLAVEAWEAEEGKEKLPLGEPGERCCLKDDQQWPTQLLFSKIWGDHTFQKSEAISFIQGCEWTMTKKEETVENTILW